MLERKREVQSDLIRVVAMLFVICIHLPVKYSDRWSVLNVPATIFFTCNGMFYMLSGKYNLRFRLGNDVSCSYKNYYIKKFKGIFLPYLLYSFILYMYSIGNIFKYEGGKKTFVYGFLETFFVSNANRHIWFMYPLMGMIIGAPFLSKMLDSFSDIELKILVLAALSWNFIEILVVRNGLLLGYSYSGWFLQGWILYFALGYCCDRLINKQYKAYIILGIIAILLSIMQKIFFGNRTQYIHDLSPIYTFATVGMYLFLERQCVINNEALKKIISFIAKYSFGVYMVHFNVLDFVVEKTGSGETFIEWIAKVAIIFVISLILSFIINNCVVRPVTGMFEIKYKK